MCLGRCMHEGIQSPRVSKEFKAPCKKEAALAQVPDFAYVADSMCLPRRLAANIQWALFLKGQKGRGQSGKFPVMQPSNHHHYHMLSAKLGMGSSKAE